MDAATVNKGFTPPPRCVQEQEDKPTTIGFQGLLRRHESQNVQLGKRKNMKKRIPNTMISAPLNVS